jgi:glycosyltransferase involved in cell wall biosynthesis
MGTPLVSAVIITYNQRDLIAAAIKSAMDQEYDNLEVIVADDASADGTAEIVEETAKSHPGRVFAVIGSENLGITGNSNRALRKCRGDYIAFMGGDDVWLPGKIQSQVDWLEADKSRVLCGHDVEYFDSYTGNSLGLWSDFHQMECGNGAVTCVRDGVPFAASAIMIRSDSLPAHGFDERLKIASDWKLWIDCLSNGGEFGFVEGVCARYRVSTNNVTIRRQHEILQDQLVLLDIVASTHPSLAKFTHSQRAHAFYKLGVLYMKRNMSKTARLLFFESLFSAFFSYRVLIALVMTYLPYNIYSKFLKDQISPRTFSEILQGTFSGVNKEVR